MIPLEMEFPTSSNADREIIRLLRLLNKNIEILIKIQSEPKA